MERERREEKAAAKPGKATHWWGEGEGCSDKGRDLPADNRIRYRTYLGTYLHAACVVHTYV